MPPKPRTPEQLQNEKDAIINATLRMIREDGLQSFTMHRLATEFDMSTSNMYNYFENKDEILSCIRTKGSDLLYSMVEAAAYETDDALERIRRFMLAAIDFGNNSREYYDLVIIDLPAKTTVSARERYNQRPGLRVADFLCSLLKACLPQKTDYELRLLSCRICTQLHGLIDYNNKSIIARMEVDYHDVLLYATDHIIEEIRRMM